MLTSKAHHSSRPCKVSVILPTHNSAAFVEEAIQSIVDQSYTDWELVICDDASTDDTYEICRRYVGTDPRVRLIRNTTPQHLSRTTNRLIEVSRGEYITIQDAADISVADRLEIQVEILDTKPDVGAVVGVGAWINSANVVFHHYPAMLLRGEQYPQSMPERVIRCVRDGAKMMNCGVMYRRQALSDIPGPLDDAALSSEDWQLAVEILHRWNIWGVPQVIEYVRRSDDQNEPAYRAMIHREARRCLKVIRDRYAGRADSPVTPWVWRQGLATHILIEARFVGGLRGLWLCLEALLYNPLYERAWVTVGEVFSRAMRKALFRSVRALTRTSQPESSR